MMISLKDIVYKPMFPLRTMIIIAVVLGIIVLLNRKHIINRILIIILLVIISQRPMLKNQNEITFALNIDVLFVVDNTVSMNAVDANGTRLNKVKSDCKRIVELLPGANYALITYANLSLVKYPFTSDMATINSVIDQMKIIDPYYAKGSTLDMPYDNIKLLLNSSSKKDKHQQILIFMGDGELIGQEKQNTNIDKFKDLKDIIDGGMVIGYGTTEGSKVKITESVVLDKITDKEGYLIDGSNNNKNLSISKLNEDNLKALASNLSLDYYHMPDDNSLSKKVQNIKDNSISNEEGEEEIDKDIYYYFSFALIILLLLELFHYRRDER